MNTRELANHEAERNMKVEENVKSRFGLFLVIPVIVAACGHVHNDAPLDAPLAPLDAPLAPLDASSRTVNVERSHAGSGTVTSTIGGIACGTTCTASVPDGTVMVLTATADASAMFAGWSGPCADTSPTCTFTVHGDVTVGAAFDLKRQPSANLFAVIDMTGTAITGNRVQSVTHYGPGRFEVTFDQDVSQCAYVATTANAYSQAIIAYTAGGHLGPQGVYVETKNQGGDLTDGPFHLFAACDAPGIRHAVVGYQANLVRATSGTSLEFLGSGRYAVTFEGPVDSCAYLATVGDPANALVFNPSGVYTGSDSDPRTVYIETKNPGGGLQDGVPFHLAVICSQAPGARFAVVNSNGVAIRSSASTTTSHVNTGRYEVAGSQPIAECATVATRGSTDTSVPFNPTTIEVIPGSTSAAAGIELRALLFLGGSLEDEAFHSATICSTP